MAKSNIVCSSYIKDPENYSELQVLKSAAGYYIGTMYNNPEGFQEPGSRDTDYFPTFEVAEDFLNRLNCMSDDEASLYLRSDP